MIDNKVVGNAIAKLRISMNMTQQSLAACLNVSHQAVSKWEKGAALPDVLTLVELSRMFGVTLEQLLSGDVDFRVEGTSEKREKPIELKLEYEDIRQKAAKAIENAEFAAAKDACEAREEGHEEAFEASYKESFESEDESDNCDIDIDKLIKMAPFMSRAALDQMALKYNGKCTPKQLIRLAPFLSKHCLEQLIINCDCEISWDTLRRLAPFLRKEAVDAFTAAAIRNEKNSSEFSDQLKNSLKKARDISDQIYNDTIKQNLKKAYNIGDQIYHDTIKPAIKKVFEADYKKQPAKPAEPAHVNRVSAARARIFERALNEERFDWIGEHIDQLDDDALKSRIAARAMELGMNEWLESYMADYCDQENIDNAIFNGNWDYVAEHISHVDEDMLTLIADTAASEGKWDWLAANLEIIVESDDARSAIVASALKNINLDWIAANIERLSLTAEESEAVAAFAIANGKLDWLKVVAEFLDGSWANADIALKAYQAGDKDLARMIVADYISDADLNELIEAAIIAEDTDFARFAVENNSGDTGAVCINLARAGHLKAVAALAEDIEPDAAAVLLDIASEQGDWELIDKFNDMLN